MQPLLYSIIKKESLHELLETFYQCINLPVQVLDENGEILDQFGEAHSYCKIFKRFLPKSESCTKIHSDASRLAMTLGETYIFSCHSNLNHIVFPLTNNNTLLGSILAGPFIMDAPDSLLLSDIARNFSHHLTLEETANQFKAFYFFRITLQFHSSSVPPLHRASD